MILQALHQLAIQENLIPGNDRDFEIKPVSWLIRVAKDGTLNFESLKEPEVLPEGSKKKPKLLARPMIVPRQGGRTCGDKAFFLVDKAEYTLGIDPDGKREPEKLKVRSSLFREQIAACAEGTGDPAVCAVHTALTRLANGESVSLPVGCAANDLLAFAYGLDEEPVHEREAVRSYWKRIQELGSGPESGNPTICLVTGRAARAGSGIPLVKNLPGGSSSGVALVSFNSTAFESYGWQGSANAPVSEEAGILAMTALNRLLHPRPPDPRDPSRELSRRNLRLSADTAVCYWSRDNGVANMLGPLLAVDQTSVESSPETVGKLYESVWRGRPFTVENPEAFYTLVISGAQGRATVRDWIETTTQQMIGALAQYFGDLRIVRCCPPSKKLGRHPPSFPLRLLLEAIADPCEKRGEGVPAALAAEMLGAAIDGKRGFPRAVFERAIARYRVEVGDEREGGNDGWKAKNWNDARAAIIRAYLNRSSRSKYSGNSSNLSKELQENMDPNNKQEGFILGQLMAVLEKLQQEAQGDINSTIVDRYFKGASASPSSVFVNLLKGARSHVRKAKTDGAGGKVFQLERLIDQLCDQFVDREVGGRPVLDRPGHNGFPKTLSAEQQGQFVLGYHQMRKWLWLPKEEKATWLAEYPDAPRAYHPIEKASVIE